MGSEVPSSSGHSVWRSEGVKVVKKVQAVAKSSDEWGETVELNGKDSSDELSDAHVMASYSASCGVMIVTDDGKGGSLGSQPAPKSVKSSLGHAQVARLTHDVNWSHPMESERSIGKMQLGNRFKIVSHKTQHIEAREPFASDTNDWRRCHQEWLRQNARARMVEADFSNLDLNLRFQKWTRQGCKLHEWTQQSPVEKHSIE